MLFVVDFGFVILVVVVLDCVVLLVVDGFVVVFDVDCCVLFIVGVV